MTIVLMLLAYPTVYLLGYREAEARWRRRPRGTVVSLDEWRRSRGR